MNKNAFEAYEALLEGMASVMFVQIMSAPRAVWALHDVALEVQEVAARGGELLAQPTTWRVSIENAFSR